MPKIINLKPQQKTNFANVRKYVLSFLILLISAAAMGQKKSIVNLIRSKSSTGIKRNGKDVIKVYQGTFKQDYSILTSDSAYFYVQDNAFDAFGHVNINQGDTLNIFADKLNYNGNTKIAILTDNVKMVDKDATLTTNHLSYNTATRIGTYTDGGKLVNKDNTLLSKNGYYFAFSRDSYFRYDVSLTTKDALVKTDTMRYNTGTKISYFYGPTNIYGTKDKDTLYTENGTYNTNTEQAFFGKKNLYKAGTRSLKGDSLFYDRLKGYGRAVKNVTFNDNEQKTTIKGNLGTYFKADERTVVTEDPYVIMVTEEKDTTATDSAIKADSTVKKPAPKMNMGTVVKNTIPAKIEVPATNQKELRAKADSALKTMPEVKKKAMTMAGVINSTIPTKIDTSASNREKLRLKADSVLKKLPGKTKGTTITASKPPAASPKIKDKPKSTAQATTTSSIVVLKNGERIKRDSIYMSADTIETQILTYKNLKIYQEKQRLAHIRDTSVKVKKPVVNEKPSKFLTGKQTGPSLSKDTNAVYADYFGKPKPKVIVKKQPKPLTKKQLKLDSLKKKVIADSVMAAKKAEPSDTARIRIMIAHHHAKLFKSDLQAKADSMFYSASDSTIRNFVNPIIWTQGSQLSGDTIYLQMKHKKFDNMTMFPNAFIVNIEKTDSIHFNQLAGKRMRGFFKDNKLNRMYVDGNAESIYFVRDSGKMTISGMGRSLSSRMRIDFKDNQATNLASYTKPESKYGPLDKFKEEERLLKGFIWKPKERPVSKESVIPSYSKKPVLKSAKPPPGKSKTVKPTPDKGPDGKEIKNTPSPKAPDLKTGKDSTLKAGPIKPPAPKPGKDSLWIDPGTLPGLKAIRNTSMKSVPGKPVKATLNDSTVIKP